MLLLFGNVELDSCCNAVTRDLKWDTHESNNLLAQSSGVDDHHRRMLM